MHPYVIEEIKITQFVQHLQGHGASPGTIEKYRRDVRRFVTWLDGNPASQEAAVRWRDSLLAEGCRPATVNSMLAAVNAFFRCMGWNIHAEFLRVQKKTFCDAPTTSSCWKPPEGCGRSAFSFFWKPSAPPASGSARCAT